MWKKFIMTFSLPIFKAQEKLVQSTLEGYGKKDFAKLKKFITENTKTILYAK